MKLKFQMTQLLSLSLKIKIINKKVYSYGIYTIAVLLQNNTKYAKLKMKSAIDNLTRPICEKHL